MRSFQRRGDRKTEKLLIWVGLVVKSGKIFRERRYVGSIRRREGLR